MKNKKHVDVHVMNKTAWKLKKTENKEFNAENHQGWNISDSVLHQI